MKASTALVGIATMLGSTVAPRPIQAQRLANESVGFRQESVRQPSPGPFGPNARDSMHIAPNQWAHGAVVGGAIGAGIGALLYFFAREIDDGPTSPWLLLGPIGIGAMVGGMIGAGTRKG